jgi:transitional endoplasmic reticulum ATPase
MVGSTNHLERLDPGISKRPSRFDRKYLFSNPKLEQRVMYAQFWREKLSTNPETSEKKADDLIPQVDFPEELCKEVAKITEDFSFAYMQEAFVSTLLQLAHGNLDEGSPTSSADETKAGNSEVEVNPGLEGLVLWKEFQKQVDILKEQMASVDNESGSRTSIPPPDADAGQPLSGVYPNGMRWQQAQPIAAHRQLR